jgi:hypothetical protein
MRLIFDKLRNFYLMKFKYQYQSPSQTMNMIVMDYVNENMLLEFESYTNGDYIGDDMNINKAILKVNDTFKDWNKVDIIVNQHAKQNEFIAIKYRTELDNINKMIVCQHVYTC